MRKRIDALLVERGIAETRAKAQEAIAARGVRVDGRVIEKCSALVEESAVLQLQRPHPWVSRGGLKLAHALDVFGIDPKDQVCLDVGASTGGFSHVLLERGARRVYAVDVGRGQVHDRLRDQPRLVVLEGVDARDLSPKEIAEPPSLVVCDASFIGAAKVLKRPLSLAAARADLVLLVKPQFEAGPGGRDKSGNLPDDVARRVAEHTAQALDGLEGFRVREMVASPVRGGGGAREFLLFASRV